MPLISSNQNRVEKCGCGKKAIIGLRRKVESHWPGRDRILITPRCYEHATGVTKTRAEERRRQRYHNEA